MRCWNRGIRKILSTDQAVSILMTVTDEEKFNVGLTSPLKPRDNCIFVVNAKLLGHRDDVLCDSSGVWDAAQGAKSHYFQKDASGTVSKITRKAYATSADAVCTLQTACLQKPECTGLQQNLLVCGRRTMRLRDGPVLFQGRPA